MINQILTQLTNLTTEIRKLFWTYEGEPTEIKKLRDRAEEDERVLEAMQEEIDSLHSSDFILRQGIRERESIIEVQLTQIREHERRGVNDNDTIWLTNLLGRRTIRRLMYCPQQVRLELLRVCEHTADHYYSQGARGVSGTDGAYGAPEGASGEVGQDGVGQPRVIRPCLSSTSSSSISSNRPSRYLNVDPINEQARQQNNEIEEQYFRENQDDIRTEATTT